MSKVIRLFLTTFMLIMLLAACGNKDKKTPATEQAEAQRLILATTTSTNDSGLLDYILPDFEKTYNAQMDVVAVGTGQAIELGVNGDADVLLVHDRTREDQFVADGNGIGRHDVMYNDYVIVGDVADPAGIRDATTAAEAFQSIFDQQAAFVSRGDDSGTHSKEKSLWQAADLEPVGDWYISAGQGMGAVLSMSDEMKAYTLSDRATYLAQREAGLALVVLFEGDPVLFNPYGVIPVNPAKHTGIHAELAQSFVEWIISDDTQNLIASFKIGGTQVFFPSANAGGD